MRGLFRYQDKYYGYKYRWGKKFQYIYDLLYKKQNDVKTDKHAIASR